MQKGKHCSKSHLRHTAPPLGRGSMDKFRTSNSESFTFPPHSPSPTLPMIIPAWRHQRPRTHLLWEMTGMSWSHHSCCIRCVRFTGIHCYGEALSSLGVQCQLMSSCTKQDLQIPSLSRFLAHNKKEEKAWEYLCTF